MDTATFFGLTASFLYAAATLPVFRSLMGRAELNKPVVLAVGSLACLLHMISAFYAIFTEVGINLGVFSIFSLFGWVAALIATGFSFYKPTENMVISAYPLAIAGILTSLFATSGYVPRPDLPVKTAVHILLSILAYSVIIIAVTQAVLVCAQNYQLKHKHFQDLVKVLPPLQTMETLLIEIIAVGVALLSLAIITGLFYLDNMFAQGMMHKTVLSIGAWGVFSAILLGRLYFGWRGTIAIRLTIIGFILLVLAYFGSKIVLEVILSA